MLLRRRPSAPPTASRLARLENGHDCVRSLGSLSARVDNDPPSSFRGFSLEPLPFGRLSEGKADAPVSEAEVLALKEHLADGPDGELGCELQAPDADLLQPLVVHVVRGDVVGEGGVDLVRCGVKQAGCRATARAKRQL